MNRRALPRPRHRNIRPLSHLHQRSVQQPQHGSRPLCRADLVPIPDLVARPNQLATPRPIPHREIRPRAPPMREPDSVPEAGHWRKRIRRRPPRPRLPSPSPSAMPPNRPASSPSAGQFAFVPIERSAAHAGTRHSCAHDLRRAIRELERASFPGKPGSEPENLRSRESCERCRLRSQDLRSRFSMPARALRVTTFSSTCSLRIVDSKRSNFSFFMIVLLGMLPIACEAVVACGGQ